MSATSEKFCLNWNDFQKNISSSFQEMRDDLDLADITLACEDRKQFQAHKFVFSSSSPLFKEILQNDKHARPLIYLKGINGGSLESVLAFIYRGIVHIYQRDLKDFLAAADELELNGLAGQQQVEEENMMENNFKEESPKSEPRTTVFTKTEPELLNADMFSVKKSG